MPQGYVPGKPKGYDTFLPSVGRDFGVIPPRATNRPPSNPEQVAPRARRAPKRRMTAPTRKGGR